MNGERNKKRPLAIFRTDASPAIGAGHVTRCLALAEALAGRGWRCAFACRKGAIDAVAALAKAGHMVGTLQGPDDADELKAIWPDGCDLLVVDHYGLDAGYESGCRDWAGKILVIDDLADRTHDCDVLLDQTVGRDRHDYADLAPPSCRVLTGSAYALLRPQFAAARAAALARRQNEKTVRRVLVSCGATDPDNVTAIVLDGLARVAPDIRVDVALGGAAPHLSKLSGNLHVDHEDMAGLMARADLAIGAAGSSAWERCCMGLPTLMLITADNQRTVARNLVETGAAMMIGDGERVTAESVAEALKFLMDRPHRLMEMRRQALTVCDGLGAGRVVIEVAPLMTRDGDQISLRPATIADSDLIFDWQSDPFTRRYFNNPKAPGRNGHTEWMKATIADPGRHLNVIMRNDVPVGVLRLDLRSGVAEPYYDVSIFIAREHAGQRIGTAALRTARHLIPQAGFVADVIAENTASRALFRAAGYRSVDGRYVCQPPSRGERN